MKIGRRSVEPETPSETSFSSKATLVQILCLAGQALRFAPGASQRRNDSGVRLFEAKEDCSQSHREDRVRLFDRVLLTKAVAIMALLCISAAEAVGPLRLPRVELVSEGSVYRAQKGTEPEGGADSPWLEGRLEQVFGLEAGTVQPIVGKRVTVVPLDATLGGRNIDLVIVGITLDFVSDENYSMMMGLVYPEVRFAPIKDKQFLSSLDPNAEHSDVCVIYPAVPFARRIPIERVKREWLPRGYSLKTVRAAIDVTADRVPDVWIFDFCADGGKLNHTKPSTDNCDRQGGERRFRQVNGWKVDRFMGD